MKIPINCRLGGVALAAAVLMAFVLPACERKSEPHPSVSQVTPKEGKPIDQTTVLPKREKVILKEGESD